MTAGTILSRFDIKYIPEPNSGCWLWIGAVLKNGYGCIRGDGRDASTLFAHRVSYSLHKGEIPGGKDVCHSCDVRSCVNPDHLFVGTRKENMQDAKKKGRLHSPNPAYLKANRMRQENKIKCPQGHPYNATNTYHYVTSDGCQHRHCRECRKMAKVRYRSGFKK